MQSASSSVAGTRAMVASGVPVDSVNHDGDTAFIIAVRKAANPWPAPWRNSAPM